MLKGRKLLRITRVPLSVLLAMSVELMAQQQPAAAPRPGGPFSGVAPAPPPLTGDMLQKPGVPEGKLSEKLTLKSQVYDGMVSDYWIYVPAQYDAKKPAAVMVFQDGEGYLNRKGGHPALNVIDNLIAQGKIPVMIAVFTNPGDISGSPGTPTYKFVEAYGKKWDRTLKDSMRSTEYDTVSDRYARFLHDELLAQVAKSYNLRTDGYSRAITGSSSGGICSFNVAWQRPEEYSRVISWIGSFTSWKEDPALTDGGQDYPEKILREEHRNIRVWVQDGSNDQENPKYGSWPLANIRMANALKLKGYDFRFSFGVGPHSQGEGAAEFAEELTWLWRGYDPANSAETFVQDPAEATKPPFRVGIVNRTP
jgi:enterochelin esterase-like enzyme